MGIDNYKLEEESLLSNILQREVDRLSKIMYNDDKYKPEFKISINCDKPSDSQEAPDLYLICNHNGWCVNRKIDLNKHDEKYNWYGEFNLKLFMEYLYNCTM